MLTIGRWIRLTPAGAVRDGEPVRLEPSDDPLLVALYRRYAGGYPKFFKMDPLCRLGFVASELLLDGEAERFTPREDRAVVLFTRSGRSPATVATSRRSPTRQTTTPARRSLSIRWPTS